MPIVVENITNQDIALKAQIFFHSLNPTELTLICILISNVKTRFSGKLKLSNLVKLTCSFKLKRECACLKNGITGPSSLESALQENLLKGGLYNCCKLTSN